MNENIIEPIVLLLGSLYLFHKAKKKNRASSLFAGISLLLFIPSLWPLFLPIKFSFALVALLAAGFLIYQKYRPQKKQDLSYYYIVLFICFGLVFLGEALFAMQA